MDIELKITFVYSSENQLAREGFKNISQSLKSIASIKQYLFEDFDDSVNDLGEYLVISSDLRGQTSLDREVYAFIENMNLFVEDNGKVYPCSNLEFCARKYLEVRQYRLELKNISELLNDEIVRLQNFYRSKVPSRSQNIAGMSITSKFKTGSQPGGDFFDIIDNKKSLQVFMCSVDSYMLNSQIIEKLLEYKQLLAQERRESNAKELILLMAELKRSFESSRMNLLVFDIEKKSRKINGYQVGQGDLFCMDQDSFVYSNNLDLSLVEASQLLKRSYFEGVIDTGSRLVISSSGVKTNWQQAYDDEGLKDLYDLLRSSEKALEGLESVIIRLYEQNCIKYDVSMIWIEVNKYDIRKV